MSSQERNAFGRRLVPLSQLKEDHMCVGSTPSAPEPPARLPEAPRAPAPSGVAGADSDAARRRRAAGTTGTILTGPRGIEDGATAAPKTLLGQ